MEAPKGVGSAVIESVMGSATGYKQAYEHWSASAQESMRMATEAHEYAGEAREKFEQCIRFLDDIAPGWRDVIAKEQRWKLFGKTAEEQAEEEAAKALVEPPMDPDRAVERARRGPHDAAHPDGDHSFELQA